MISGPRTLIPMFPAASRMAGGGNPWRLVAGDQAAAGFDVYDEEGRLLQRVRWQAHGRPPDNRDLALSREAYLNTTGRDPAAARRSLDVMPPTRHTPVFDELHVARHNDVWVRRYPLPTDSVSLWWVFREGHLQATIEVPADFDILEVGADYVLARRLDVLGVERVELWRYSAG